ncbi:hypothetical protein IMSAGC008_02122 [Muribaculaceae bacterium]|nr:hypothetical protein IMSAGC008_02122 [Muribaculaceae bacterium]
MVCKESTSTGRTFRATTVEKAVSAPGDATTAKGGIVTVPGSNACMVKSKFMRVRPLLLELTLSEATTSTPWNSIYSLPGVSTGKSTSWAVDVTASGMSTVTSKWARSPMVSCALSISALTVTADDGRASAAENPAASIKKAAAILFMPVILLNGF